MDQDSFARDNAPKRQPHPAIVGKLNLQKLNNPLNVTERDSFNDSTSVMNLSSRMTLEMETFRSSNYNYDVCVHEPKVYKDQTCKIDLCEKCFSIPYHRNCKKECLVNKIDLLMGQYERHYEELKLIHDDLSYIFFDLQKEYMRFFRPILQRVRQIKKEFVGDLLVIDKKWKPKLKQSKQMIQDIKDCLINEQSDQVVDDRDEIVKFIKSLKDNSTTQSISLVQEIDSKIRKAMQKVIKEEIMNVSKSLTKEKMKIGWVKVNGSQNFLNGDVNSSGIHLSLPSLGINQSMSDSILSAAAQVPFFQKISFFAQDQTNERELYIAYDVAEQTHTAYQIPIQAHQIDCFVRTETEEVFIVPNVDFQLNKHSLGISKNSFLQLKKNRLHEKAERNFIFTPGQGTLVPSTIEKKSFVFAMGVGTGIEMEMYDVNKDQWFILPSFSIFPISKGAMFCIQNTALYVMTADYGKAFINTMTLEELFLKENYNLGKLNWQQYTLEIDFELYPFEGAIQITENDILIFGGDSTDCYVFNVDQFQLYEFDKDMPFRCEVVSISQATYCKGKLYIAGYSGQNSYELQMFDLEENEWYIKWQEETSWGKEFKQILSDDEDQLSQKEDTDSDVYVEDYLLTQRSQASIGNILLNID